jgi:hypothetical protein
MIVAGILAIIMPLAAAIAVNVSISLNKPNEWSAKSDHL